MVGWLLASISGVASRGRMHQALTISRPRPSHERLCSRTRRTPPPHPKCTESHKSHCGLGWHI